MAHIAVSIGCAFSNASFGCVKGCRSYNLPAQIKTVRGSTRATWQLRIPRGSQAILGRTALSADGKLAFTSLALTRDAVTTPRVQSKVISKQFQT